MKKESKTKKSNKAEIVDDNVGKNLNKSELDESRVKLTGLEKSGFFEK